VIAASVSIVACERAPAGLKACCERRRPGGAEHQKNISDDRAGNRRFDHIVEPGAQRRKGDDEFGGVAESRVQKPPNCVTQPVGQLLGGAAHPPG
jgi:hypothetical protein